MTRKKTKTPKTVKYALWLLAGAMQKATRADQVAMQIATAADRETIEALGGQFKCAEYYKKTGKAYAEKKCFETARKGKYAAVR